MPFRGSKLRTVFYCGFTFLLSSYTYGQIGVKLPLHFPGPQRADSLGVAFPSPLLPLRDWKNLSDQYLEVKNDDKIPDVYHYISPDYMPKNPFEIDLRQTSNYVPREVRDELNLMMNRPKDSAFLPILPVAFIALQLASQYLIIQSKTAITAENIRNSQAGLPVLKQLWRQNPQTLSELYKCADISPHFTMTELQKILDLLIDNKLVRTRIIENAEMKYFYAIDEASYQNILSRIELQDTDSLHSKTPLFNQDHGQ
jgi:hypothetical protein